MPTLAEALELERKGQEITLFLKWPGFVNMTPDHTIELAHALLAHAFEAKREAGTIDLRRPPGSEKGA